MEAIAYYRMARLYVTTCSMQITIEIPDEIAQQLDETQGNLSRRLLDSLLPMPTVVARLTRLKFVKFSSYQIVLQVMLF